MDTKRNHGAATATGDGNGSGPDPHDTTDFLGLDSRLSEEEIGARERVRSFVREEIRPNIKDWFDRAVFPKEIVPRFAELGLLGMHLEGYGCAGRSAVEYGLACMELEAGDSGLRTFVSVQGSLAMSAIYKFGSEEQKNEWLPRMAKGEAIGCFGLTEPSAGSDPASMKTFARKDGSDWVLNGSKDRSGLHSRHRRDLGPHRRGEEPRARLPRSDGYARLHGQGHHPQALHAREHTVRHNPGGR
jgi:glutaryl-CoA dehydrogenase